MRKIIILVLCVMFVLPVNVWAVNASWVGKSDYASQIVTGTSKKSSGGSSSSANVIQSTQVIGENSYQNLGLGLLQEPITYQYQSPMGLQAPPAWAQKPLTPLSSNILYPFASNLFEGNFASTYRVNYNPEYQIQAGDRIELRVWGAVNFDSILTVDTQGNIFVPEVGPIFVLGVKQKSLLSEIKSKILKVYTNDVEVYVNLQTALPLSVYVTGFVVKPGRYAGNSNDPVLAFIDRAGGIQSDRGSYRNIQIIRSKNAIANIDLYEFALYGRLPNIQLKEGDIILVNEKAMSIAATGSIRDEAVYELVKTYTGKSLIDYCSPLPGVSHVSLSGIRNNEPINEYLTLEDFQTKVLYDGDIVDFIIGKQSQTIMVSVRGAIEGNNRFPVKRGTTLKSLLPYIKVNSGIASTDSIYILRQSVADQQKTILKDSLKRLEQSALTATSSTTTEASIRVQEAQLIQNFVQRASLLEPDGVVVVAHNGSISDLILEDHDIIVVPQYSDVVHVSGEVMIPKAIAWNESMELDEYIKSAGGFSNRANKKDVLVVRMNGEVGKVAEMGINKGDRILVLPRFDSKNLDLISTITQILYQIAIATSVVVDITDNN